MATLHEVQQHYSLEDLANANDALDAVAEHREAAAAAAERSKPKGLLL